MKHSVAGIAFHDGCFFVAKRVPKGDMGGRWEFPGGKVEDGESYEDTLKREFEEEFSFKIDVGEHILDSFFEHGGKKVCLHAYEVFLPEDLSSAKLTEHTEFDFVTIKQIENELLFVDSDLSLLPGVKKWLKK